MKKRSPVDVGPGRASRAAGVALAGLVDRRGHADVRRARLAQALSAIAAASQATPT